MNETKLLIDVEQSPKKKYQIFLLALQQVLGVLVATITVPLLIPGFPIAAAMLSAGIGTLFYIFVTKKKSPVFLSSNFTYIAPISSALAIGGITNATGQPANYAAVMFGMLVVGLVYALVAIIAKRVGTKWLDRLLPPVVIGPTIMIIGLSLSVGAVNNLTGITAPNYDINDYNLISILCGLVALFATAFAGHYGKGKMAGLIPFIIGLMSGYILALLVTLIGFYGCGEEYCKIINFQPFVDAYSLENLSFASFLNYKMFIPNDKDSFLFLRFDELKQFDWISIMRVIIIFVPIAFVSICEHIGDHKNLSNIIDRDLLGEEPGLTRTLIGDGLATTISGQLCGLANTTYGESIAIIGTTRIASIKVMIVAATLMCLFSFATPITIFIETIPPCIVGGISLVLYGFISMSGMRLLLTSGIDFNKSKNIFIISAILVAGIGGFVLKFGDPSNPIIEITPVALAMIIGILLNVVLRDKVRKEE